MRRWQYGIAVAALGIGAAGCDMATNSVAAATTATVAMQDQCDSSSFNATLGPGTCMQKGSVTLSQFNAELSASGSVAEWRFVPASLSARVGERIMATNQGGERHTFTRVAQFGGGIVQNLNTASGNPTETPECRSVTAADLVAPGASVTTQTYASTGTVLYQCCIHPWMRTTVTVNP